MRRYAALLLVLSACADDLDTAHVVNVAPSAHSQMSAILQAVDSLNTRIGSESYSVRAVDTEAKRDDEIILRLGRSEDLAVGELMSADTLRTHTGVIIRVPTGCPSYVIAHELGHAAGLEHVIDVDNLMCETAGTGAWVLTAAQVASIRE